jgi:hypothetical protein
MLIQRFQPPQLLTAEQADAIRADSRTVEGPCQRLTTCKACGLVIFPGETRLIGKIGREDGRSFHSVYLHVACGTGRAA